MAEFSLEGFDVMELIGFGPTGQVYRARDQASGELVALKRLRPEAMAVVDRLRRDAALAATADRRHVAVVQDVAVSETDVVLVMTYAESGSLAEVLARRGRLAAGEAVTTLAPIARVLGRIHDSNGVHGNVTPANILVAADGRPLLADFGVATALAIDLTAVDASADFLDPALFVGTAPSAAGDVYSLGAIGFAAVAGQPPRIGNDRLSRFCPDAPAGLVAAIESAIDSDAGSRPTATEFGEFLMAACRAAPLATTPAAPQSTAQPAGATRTVRVSGPLPPPSRSPHPGVAPGPPRPRTGRLAVPPPPPTRPAVPFDDEPDPPARATPTTARLAVGGIFVFGLILLGGAGWSRLHSSAADSPSQPIASPPAASARSRPSASPSPLTNASPPAAAAWRGIIGYLDATRAQAFATAQPGLLRNVYLANAPGLSVDEASVRSLARRGLHAAGFTATVERISVKAANQSAATIRVVDRLSAYRLVDHDGATVSTGAGRAARAYTMTLVRTPAGWRVSAILP